MEKYIKPEMLSIDVDELMTIFIYIIYKCKMPLLFVHADFINYFVMMEPRHIYVPLKQ